MIGLVAFSQRWSVYRFVLPSLRRVLPEKGLSAADLHWVLVERPTDFKNWNEIEDELRAAVPLWLWSARALRSEPV